MESINDFNDYMEKYKELSLKEKQQIMIKQLKLLASFSNTLCKEIGIDNEMILNKEIIDVEKENYTEDDFAEAGIVLVNSIQNSICDFHLKFSDIIEDRMKQEEN